MFQTLSFFVADVKTTLSDGGMFKTPNHLHFCAQIFLKSYASVIVALFSRLVSQRSLYFIRLYQLRLMKTKHLITRLCLVFFTVAAILAACQEEESKPKNQADAASTETVTELYFNDVADLSATVARSSNAELENGRASSFRDDDRICDNSVEWIHDGVAPDSIYIDFKTGCPDTRGNIRKGKLLITYTTASRFDNNSVITVTSIDYSINNVSIAGRWTLKNITADGGNYRVKAIVENGKATWPDQTFALREHTIFQEWISTDGTTNPLSVESKVWGEASGKNRDGESYTGVVLESDPLVYSVKCAAQKGAFIPVKGTKIISVASSGLVINVDYGSGECDNSALVTGSGFSATIRVND
jgi:hypothetical protein